MGPAQVRGAEVFPWAFSHSPFFVLVKMSFEEFVSHRKVGSVGSSCGAPPHGSAWTLLARCVGVACLASAEFQFDMEKWIVGIVIDRSTQNGEVIPQDFSHHAIHERNGLVGTCSYN